jgi:hypothetical protein
LRGLVWYSYCLEEGCRAGFSAQWYEALWTQDAFTRFGFPALRWAQMVAGYSTHGCGDRAKD